MANLQRQVGEFIELTNEGLAEIQSHPNNYNDDTKPIFPSERDWGTREFITLWTGILVSIPVYMMASGMMAAGMSWAQALFVCVLGHSLVIIPSVLLGHFGTKYGTNFPLLSKMAFGPLGNIVPTLIRGFMGCLWFGIQCWIGGIALDSILGLMPFWHNIPGHAGISFVIFALSNIYIGYHGSRAVKFLENYSAPILIVMSLCVIGWALYNGHGFSGIFHTKVAGGATGAEFWKLFFPSLTAMIAFDSTIAMNFSDFTRHSKSQKSQIIGQFIGAPLMTAFIVFVGICGSAGSELAFGEAYWNPSVLVAHFSNPLIVFIFSLFIILATVTTNVACNLVPAAIIISTLFSKLFNFRNAVFAAGIIAACFMPWKLLANPNNYVFLVNGTLAVFLGPMTGIYLATYWAQYKTNLLLPDLYRLDGGAYYYQKGWNTLGVTILAATVVFIFICKAVPALRWIYDSSYLIGLLLALIIYAAMCRKSPQNA